MTIFVLINPFEVPEDIDDDQFLEGWGRAADYMRSCPGFVGSELHRAVSPSGSPRRTSRRLLEVPGSRRWRRTRPPTTRPSTRSCAPSDARLPHPKGDKR